MNAIVYTKSEGVLFFANVREVGRASYEGVRLMDYGYQEIRQFESGDVVKIELFNGD